MSGLYVRPSHSSPFNDGSSTDATELIATLSAGVEALEVTAGSLTSASMAVSPATPIITALRHGQSATMQALGDSTGDATNEWFSLLGQQVSAVVDCNVVWLPWNDTNQNYDPPTTLVAGASGDRYVTLATGALQYAATSITGDIEIIAKVNATNYANGTQTLLSKYDTTGNQRGWQLNLTATGRLSWIWSADGIAATTTTSTAAVPFTNGTTGWVRVTFQVNNGSSGNTATYYTSTDGTAWSTLGTPVITAGVTSIFNNTPAYQIGSQGPSFAQPFAGNVYWTQIRNGLAFGPPVAPPLPDDWQQASSATTNTVIFGGSPTLLLVSGSQSGQAISYLDNVTRRPKIQAPHGQDVIFLSSGQNEGLTTGAAWVTALGGWVTNTKAQQPGVPIVILTQNPTNSSGTLINGANDKQIRAARGADTARYGTSQAGVWVVDTYRAFTNLAVQINATDGLHPTHEGDPGVPVGQSGSTVWASYLFVALFRGA